MNRTDFIKIIKLRGFWKIDKRKGNYNLPDGNRLSDYVYKLVCSQLELDNSAITSTGNIQPCSFDNMKYTIMPPFLESETCDFCEMESRIEKLVNDIIR